MPREGEQGVEFEGQCMSLNNKKILVEIAKSTCRELRRNSTDAEKILWCKLRDKQLLNAKFYRQHPVFYDLTGKESFFVADFYCHEKKLAIELEGNIHEHKLKEDAKRTEILNYLGIHVLRFKNDDVENKIEKVLSRITKRLINSPAE